MAVGPVCGSWLQAHPTELVISWRSVPACRAPSRVAVWKGALRYINQCSRREVECCRKSKDCGERGHVLAAFNLSDVATFKPGPVGESLLGNPTLGPRRSYSRSKSRGQHRIGRLGAARPPGAHRCLWHGQEPRPGT